MSGEEIKPEKLQQVTADELTELTRPQYSLLELQGAMCSNEFIDFKDCIRLQRPVLGDAVAVVKLRLKREQRYRKRAYKSQLRQDKWQHKDYVNGIKRARKQQMSALKAKNKQEDSERRKILRQKRKDKLSTVLQRFTGLFKRKKSRTEPPER